MALPFLLSNKDWQELRPKAIEELGKRKDLDPEQERFLGIFRIVDLRVEWVCGQVVVIRNTLVILIGLFLAINGVQIVNLFRAYFFNK